MAKGNEKIDVNVIEMLNQMRTDLSTQITDSEGRISTQITEAVKSANGRIDEHDIRIRAVERNQSTQDGTAKGISISAHVVYVLIVLIVGLLTYFSQQKNRNHEINKENIIRIEENTRGQASER